MRSFFISGTDTNIGKTFVSALLVRHAIMQKMQVAYFKPIQTGYPPDDDAHMVSRLAGENGFTAKTGLTFAQPLSPHAAAKHENSEIDFLALIMKSKALQEDVIFYEGAGGLLVPINKEKLMIDLIKELSTPVVLVAPSRLGVINHTLLSLEALRAKKISLIGIALIGDFNNDNEEAIRFYGHADNIISLPWLKNLDQASLAALALDRKSDLEQFIGF